MEIAKLKEKYPTFFELFSPALIDFALSEKTAENIANICIENHIFEEEKIKNISFYVAFVIFGIYQKETLKNIFEEKVGIGKDVVEKFVATADELIFSKIPTKETEKKEKEEIISDVVVPKKIEKDDYRESVE